MDIHDRNALKSQAQRALRAASYAPGKLMLIYAGASAILLLLVTALNFVLQNQIATTGGLSGLGMRAVLETVQSVAQIAIPLVLPFWEIGYISAVMRLSRRQEATPVTLLEGFRQFGPVLRFTLLRNIIFAGLAMVLIYPVTFLYMATPFAQPLMEIMEPLVTEESILSGQIMLDEATVAAMTDAMMPMLVMFLIIYLIAAIPLFYRFRMAQFRLMDAPKEGAMAALRSSRQMMRGNCVSLFKLDLSFWWFYAAEALLVVIGYGDAILPLLGITLPVSADVAFFLFYILNLAGQVALYYFAKNQVMVTYASYYDALQDTPPEIPAAPKNMPWNY